MAGQDGSIVGYVHTGVFESVGPAPASPAEALQQTGTVTGNLYEVFDASGAIVGYFASEGYGFVDSAAKDELVERGFRLLEAPAPMDEPASPMSTVEPATVMAPSTTEVP